MDWDRPLYASCDNCAQYVENTPSGWHSHECHAPLVAQVRGFVDKVRPGGSGSRRVRHSELECELITLQTDLARWNEFAEWEGNCLASSLT